MDGPLPLASLSAFLQASLTGDWQLSCGLPLAQTASPAPSVGAFLCFEGMLVPQQRFGLWLDTPLLLAVVDRALGGTGVPDAPSGHHAGAPSEAELGVLAYVAARTLRDLVLPLRLANIASQPPAAESDAVALPIAVRLDGVASSARVTLSAEVAMRFGPQLPVAWVLAAEPGELDGLEAGDLVLAEGTGHGRGGFVRAQGLEGYLPVERASGAAEFRMRLGPQPPSGALQLETAAGQLDLAALARLQTPGAAPVGLDLDGSQAFLRRAGKRVAQGELVTLRGRAGLKISDCCAQGLTREPT